MKVPYSVVEAIVSICYHEWSETVQWEITHPADWVAPDKDQVVAVREYKFQCQARFNKCVTMYSQDPEAFAECKALAKPLPIGEAKKILRQYETFRHYKVMGFKYLRAQGMSYSAILGYIVSTKVCGF